MKKCFPARFLTAFCLLAALILPLCALAEGESTTPSTTGSGSALVDAMHIDAAAAILIDADTGEVLYEQDAHVQRFPASITKVMTCLLAIEAVDRGELALDKKVTVSSSLHTGIGEGGSTADLKEGEIISIEDLLYSALVPSANEACNVLAETVAGDISSFVALMNQRAAELGMADTHFANTHGYHDPNHYTSAHDVALMCMEAMKHPMFREIVASKSHDLPATNMHEARTLHTTNALISTWRVREYYYQEATGIKTGSTPEAGYCLASSATRGDKDLIAVVMGGTDYKANAETNYFTESERLLRFGFDTFQTTTILDESEVDIAEVSVTLSNGADYVTVHPAQSIQVTLPKDMDVTAFARTVDLPQSVEAPIHTGDKLGTITITYRDKTYGTVDLLANSDVSRSEWLYRIDRVQKFFGLLWVRILLVVIALTVLFLVLRRAILGKRRSRYGPSNRGSYRAKRYTGGRRRR